MDLVLAHARVFSLMHQHPTKSQVDGETQYVAGKTEEVDAPPQARRESP